MMLIHNAFILDTKESSVRIAPGVTTGELMEQFLKEDVCFESDVILLGVTYGGVIPTGCHVRYLINECNYDGAYEVFLRQISMWYMVTACFIIYRVLAKIRKSLLTG